MTDVICWGSNAQGSLGVGDQRLSPAAVRMLSGVSYIQSSKAFHCRFQYIDCPHSYFQSIALPCSWHLTVFAWQLAMWDRNILFRHFKSALHDCTLKCQCSSGLSGLVYAIGNCEDVKISFLTRLRVWISTSLMCFCVMYRRSPYWISTIHQHHQVRIRSHSKYICQRCWTY